MAPRLAEAARLGWHWLEGLCNEALAPRLTSLPIYPYRASYAVEHVERHCAYPGQNVPTGSDEAGKHIDNKAGKPEKTKHRAIPGQSVLTGIVTAGENTNPNP